jgi:hypothetical protein
MDFTQQQQQKRAEGIIMKPEPEDEPPQQLESKPRRLYQAWRGNNVCTTVPFSSSSLFFLSFTSNLFLRGKTRANETTNFR